LFEEIKGIELFRNIQWGGTGWWQYY